MDQQRRDQQQGRPPREPREPREPGSRVQTKRRASHGRRCRKARKANAAAGVTVAAVVTAVRANAVPAEQRVDAPAAGHPQAEFPAMEQSVVTAVTESQSSATVADSIPEAQPPVERQAQAPAQAFVAEPPVAPEVSAAPVVQAPEIEAPAPAPVQVPVEAPRPVVAEKAAPEPALIAKPEASPLPVAAPVAAADPKVLLSGAGLEMVETDPSRSKSYHARRGAGETWPSASFADAAIRAGSAHAGGNEELGATRSGAPPLLRSPLTVLAGAVRRAVRGAIRGLRLPPGRARARSPDRHRCTDREPRLRRRSFAYVRNSLSLWRCSGGQTRSSV